MSTITKAGVIGAGVMGAGIAAHLANAGIAVVLLDVAAAGRDLAAEAVAKQAKTGGLMHPGFAARITTGTIENDLALLADADWVIEAVVELAEVKRALYTRLDQVVPADCAISSNTSTIPLADLMAGLPAALARRFMITHFFNPPRYMRLLEVVSGPATDAAIATKVAAFAHVGLGKNVVPCKDTPGFLANRIGCLWMSAAMRCAFEQGLSVEEADAVIGKPFGIPATGIFGLTDLVGIDLMPKVWDSFLQTLPATDAFHQCYQPMTVVEALVARGTIGRKAGAGFFRKGKTGMEVLDFATLDYRPVAKPALASLASADMRTLLSHDDRGGRYAWAVMSATLSYAASLVPEISDTIAPVDEAMRLGYNWSKGPFQLIDEIGADWLAQRLTAEGRPVPALLRQAVAAGGFYAEGANGPEALTLQGQRLPVARPAGQILVADLRRANRKVQGNDAATLWDMGNGVACLEFHRKMNAMAPDSLDAIEAALAAVANTFQALVIGNDAPAFSAGADLGRFLTALDQGDMAFLSDFVRRGQTVYEGVRQAPFPVVGAVAGLALGGGCEILLHCDAIQAHGESNMGLVERNVGLIPAWGGCRRLLVRAITDPDMAKGPLPASLAAFETIATAAVSTSAAQARDLRFLRPADRITMHRDRLLADAKTRALELVAGYQPPGELDLRLPGPSGRHTLMNRAETLAPLGVLRGHDMAIAAALATVLSGGDADPVKPVSEALISELEHQAFLALAASPATRERIAHMLKTGKPLKN